jgi:methyl-accepting chemotaxis protein
MGADDGGTMAGKSISRRLPVMIVALALVVGTGIGTAGYVIGSRTAEELTFARLAGIAADRSNLLASYLESRELAVFTASRSETVQNALRDLHFGWVKLGDNAEQQLVDAYVSGNPFAENERQLLDDAKLGTNYDSAHARIQPAMRVLAESAGFEDIYLFNADGRNVYSVNKGPDFAAGFGPDEALGASLLGRLVSALGDGQSVLVSDIAQYEPTGGQPTAFMAAPVLDKRGNRAGAIAVRLPIGEFGALINRRDGLGETGEVVIVGADHLLRNESAFSDVNDVLATRLDSAAIEAALGGIPARARLAASHRPGTLLVNAAPLEHGGLDWAIVTMMGTDEALAPVVAMGQTMLASAVALLLVAGIVAIVLSRRLAQPISSLTRVMTSLAAGRLDLEVPHARRDDEIGDMARAVEVFRENGVRIAELSEAAATQAEADRRVRAQMMSDLRAAFGDVVDAAAGGDFSRRIEAGFDDAELAALAHGINSLVETVDRGLTETATVLAALADADLTKRIEGEYDGAFADLRQDLNRVAERLSEIVAQLRQASGHLRGATGEILSGADDLARRTAVQSSTIESTTATMEVLARTVQQNAARAKEATTLATTLMETAEQSGEVMEQATLSMQRITASSEQIAGIVGLIDDIAFQTNLLALNASVEAARAGELGAGFAVVAVEVRRLAQSAASASADIKALIERASSEVAGGSRLVADVAAKLQTMVSGARSSNALVGEIARESADQAASIGQVSSGMRTLDEMTRRDAALVEDTRQAIGRSENSVVELERLVDIFRLADRQRATHGGRERAA